ncbi:MAG TPA: hypothetical protein VM580_01925, partial [Labilithrix sp.]|nr:hypothetical protein [Labilithrix sp.]
ADVRRSIDRARGSGIMKAARASTGKYAWHVSVTDTDRLTFERMDLATLERVTIATEVPVAKREFRVTWAPDGAPYVVASDRGRHTILRFSDDGPSVVPPDELALFSNTHIVDLVVERDLFLLLGPRSERPARPLARRARRNAAGGAARGPRRAMTAPRMRATSIRQRLESDVQRPRSPRRSRAE